MSQPNAARDPSAAREPARNSLGLPARLASVRITTAPTSGGAALGIAWECEAGLACVLPGAIIRLAADVSAAAWAS
jgi:hypothetical protein